MGPAEKRRVLKAALYDDLDELFEAIREENTSLTEQILSHEEVGVNAFNRNGPGDALRGGIWEHQMHGGSSESGGNIMSQKQSHAIRSCAKFSEPWLWRDVSDAGLDGEQRRKAPGGVEFRRRRRPRQRSTTGARRKV